jgi:hypothetical protein
MTDAPATLAPGTKCCYRKRGGTIFRAEWEKCSRYAKVIRVGKPYCGIHDPQRILDKREEKLRLFDLKKLSEQKQRAIAAAHRAIADAAIEQIESDETFNKLSPIWEAYQAWHIAGGRS